MKNDGWRTRDMTNPYYRGIRDGINEVFSILEKEIVDDRCSCEEQNSCYAHRILYALQNEFGISRG